MAYPFIHVYSTDHGDSGALSAGYAGKQVTTVAFGPTTAPTLYKDLRLSLYLRRANACSYCVIIGSAPDAIRSDMVAASPFTSSFWNTYGKYVWAHQSFVGGGYPTANTGNKTEDKCELSTVTRRSMGIGEPIFFVVWVIDQSNNTTAVDFHYIVEYDYQILLNAP